MSQGIHPKVAVAAQGATMSGSLAVIVVWALGLRGIAVPAEVAAAFVSVIAGAAAFFAGWQTPSPPIVVPNPSPPPAELVVDPNPSPAPKAQGAAPA